MSSEHLTTEALKGYVKRTLDPDDLLSADRHLQACGECRGRLCELKPMQKAAAILSKACESDGEVDLHLSYDQMEAHVDGTNDDVAREIVDVHTAECSSCLDQLNDLRELKEIIGGQRVGTVPSSATQIRFWDKIAAALTVRTALAAGTLVILGLGLWGISNLMTSDPIETVVVNEEAPGEVPQRDQSRAPNDNGGSEVAGLDDHANREMKPVVSLVDGGYRLEIDERGSIKGIDPGRFENRLKAVLTTQDIQVSPMARELRTTSGVLMSGGSPGAPFALTAPVGRVISSDQPRFSWRPLADAESYVVSVFDENFTKVAESPGLKDATWTPAIRLKRGAIYNWQVTAIKAGQEIKFPVRPAPDARFKVINATAANDIEAAQKTRSHLLLGTVYANAGMTAEAEREFQILVKQNPRSELAKKLLQKVQANK